jgi:hypothetical protein
LIIITEKVSNWSSGASAFLIKIIGASNTAIQREAFSRQKPKARYSKDVNDSESNPGAMHFQSMQIERHPCKLHSTHTRISMESHDFTVAPVVLFQTRILNLAKD